jgi:hypothetical protein
MIETIIIAAAAYAAGAFTPSIERKIKAKFVAEANTVKAAAGAQASSALASVVAAAEADIAKAIAAIKAAI